MSKSNPVSNKFTGVNSCLHEILGYLGFELQPLSTHRMVKPEAPRMQHLPWIFRKRFSVNFIPQDRVTEVAEMNPDLVGAAGQQPAKDQRAIICLR
jgi:hypothetical protein